MQRILFFYLILTATLYVEAQNVVKYYRYKIAACDWMMLKRQKIGSFQLMNEMGGDGVEMDMGSLGTRDTFDNKLHQPHYQKLFPATAKKFNVEIPSVAMSGFYGQSFLKHNNYRGLIEDCINTMKYVDAKVAFLPLGGIREDWTKKGADRDSLVYRLHAVGEMAKKNGIVIGIRTPLDAKENIRLLKEIDSKGISLYYSFQVALDNNRDINKELKELGKKRICQIHCSNTDGYLLKDDRELDFSKIKQTLDEMKWKGWLVIERSRDKKKVRDVKHNFGENIRYLKSKFQ